MNKNHQEELDKLFAQAKQEKPLLSLQEVENKIHTAPVPRGVVARYWPAIVSGLAIMAAGWTIYNVAQDKNDLNKIDLNKIDLNKNMLAKNETNYLKSLGIPKPNPAAIEEQVSKKPSQKSKRNTVPNNQLKPHFSIQPVKYLKLSEEEFKAIGVQLGLNELKIFTKRKNNYFIWEVNNNGQGVQIINPTNPDYKFYQENFSYTTFKLRHVTQKKMDRISVNYGDSIVSDFLIPIKIDLKNYSIGTDAVLVLWYEPTEEFIAALPGRYQEELAAEFIKSQQQLASGFEEPTSCGYFETFCRDISIFDRIRVFPNPATTHMTANFETLEDCQLSVDLMNIEGQLVQNVFNGSISGGVQKIVLDVSSIVPDLYLLKFEASNGEYETMRVIIKR